MLLQTAGAVWADVLRELQLKAISVEQPWRKDAEVSLERFLPAADAVVEWQLDESNLQSSMLNLAHVRTPFNFSALFVDCSFRVIYFYFSAVPPLHSFVCI